MIGLRHHCRRFASAGLVFYSGRLGRSCLAVVGPRGCRFESLFTTLLIEQMSGSSLSCGVRARCRCPLRDPGASSRATPASSSPAWAGAAGEPAVRVSGPWPAHALGQLTALPGRGVKVGGVPSTIDFIPGCLTSLESASLGTPWPAPTSSPQVCLQTRLYSHRHIMSKTLEAGPADRVMRKMIMPEASSAQPFVLHIPTSSSSTSALHSDICSDTG